MGTWNFRYFCIDSSELTPASTTCLRGGGGKRDRTADLLHAMQALSQLSYTPAGTDKIKAAFATFVTTAATGITTCRDSYNKLRLPNLGVPTGIRTPVLTVKG